MPYNRSPSGRVSATIRITGRKSNKVRCKVVSRCAVAKAILARLAERGTVPALTTTTTLVQYSSTTNDVSPARAWSSMSERLHLTQRGSKAGATAAAHWCHPGCCATACIQENLSPISIRVTWHEQTPRDPGSCAECNNFLETVPTLRDVGREPATITATSPNQPHTGAITSQVHTTGTGNSSMSAQCGNRTTDHRPSSLGNLEPSHSLCCHQNHHSHTHTHTHTCYRDYISRATVVSEMWQNTGPGTVPVAKRFPRRLPRPRPRVALPTATAGVNAA